MAEALWQILSVVWCIFGGVWTDVNGLSVNTVMFELQVSDIENYSTAMC